MNKLTVTRREVGGDNGGKSRKGHQGTCIKDTWTKPKVGRIKGGRWGSLGWMGVMGGKWRKLYLNDNKRWGGGRGRERKAKKKKEIC